MSDHVVKQRRTREAEGRQRPLQPEATKLWKPQRAYLGLEASKVACGRPVAGGPKGYMSQIPAKAGTDGHTTPRLDKCEVARTLQKGKTFQEPKMEYVPPKRVPLVKEYRGCQTTIGTPKGSSQNKQH